MTWLCKHFGHAYKQETRFSTHWQSDTRHQETWNVCKRKGCKFEHKAFTGRVVSNSDVLRGWR